MCELLHTSLCGIRIFKADRLSAASLVTAEATVRAPLSDSSNRIALVAMGDNVLKRADDHEVCPIHLRNRREVRSSDGDAIRRLILAGRGPALSRAGPTEFAPGGR